MEKPDVDYIDGLSPAISIDQKGASRNPRSTVGTVTEIYDYLRLLFARIGRTHCPNCGRADQPADRAADRRLSSPSCPRATRLMIMAPLVRDRKGEHEACWRTPGGRASCACASTARCTTSTRRSSLDKKYKHTIEVVVDRLVTEAGTAERRQPRQRPDASRMADSVETALRLADGRLSVDLPDEAGGAERLFSEQLACPEHGGLSFEELAPRNFSFNRPHGACPDCTGLGVKLEIDPSWCCPTRTSRCREGAIVPWRRMVATGRWYSRILEASRRSTASA